jgi:hypothetical protein
VVVVVSAKTNYGGAPILVNLDLLKHAPYRAAKLVIQCVQRELLNDLLVRGFVMCGLEFVLELSVLPFALSEFVRVFRNTLPEIMDTVQKCFVLRYIANRKEVLGFDRLRELSDIRLFVPCVNHLGYPRLTVARGESKD